MRYELELVVLSRSIANFELSCPYGDNPERMLGIHGRPQFAETYLITDRNAKVGLDSQNTERITFRVDKAAAYSLSLLLGDHVHIVHLSSKCGEAILVVLGALRNGIDIQK